MADMQTHDSPISSRSKAIPKTSQFAASVAPVMFTPEFNCQQFEPLAELRNENKAYIIRSLVFIAAAAVHPELLSANRRLESIRTATTLLGTDTADHHDHPEVAESQRHWADAGFFLLAGDAAALGPTRNVRCFHCGICCSFTAAEQDPLQLHRRRSPNCELARLLSFISQCQMTLHTKAAAEVSASAGKLCLATAKLLAGLRESRLLEHVESYGLDRRWAAFCACRQFMRTRNGQLPARPGDLMQEMYDTETLMFSLPDKLCLEAALKEIDACSNGCGETPQSTVDADGCCRQTAPRIDSNVVELPQETVGKAALAASSKSDTEQRRRQGCEDADEKCVACRQNVRNQVTLPCAHFLLCRHCAGNERSCPKCGREILATVRAFIA